LRVSFFEKEITNVINNEMELFKLKKMGNVRKNHNKGAFTVATPLWPSVGVKPNTWKG
jgi:hypothetical protein